jgi:hypothetical protein
LGCAEPISRPTRSTAGSRPRPASLHQHIERVGQASLDRLQVALVQLSDDAIGQQKPGEPGYGDRHDTMRCGPSGALDQQPAQQGQPEECKQLGANERRQRGAAAQPRCRQAQLQVGQGAGRQHAAAGDGLADTSDQPQQP